LPLVPSVFVSWLNGNIDRFLLLFFIGIGSAGIFGAAGKVALIVGLLVSVFQQAWYPLAVRLLGDISGRLDIYRQTLNYYIEIMFSFALIVSSLSKEILELIVSPQYVGGYVAIPWLAGAIILHGTANFTNVGLEIMKATGGNSVAAVIGAIANIMIGALLVSN
jgi:O-antigen/teichoic acid export membrane protein